MELGEGLAAIGAEGPAVEAFAKVIEIRPGFLPVYYHLERLNMDREDWNGVLTALEGIEAGATTKKVKKAANARTQALLEEKGVTSDSAWDFYAKLHGREPESLVALRGLGAISLSRGDLGAAAGYFSSLAEHASDPTAKADAATQLGLIALQTDKGEADAIKHFEAAIEHHATHRPALEQLREIHTRTENWSGLVAVLARESALVTEDARLPYFVDIAKLWEEKISNAKVAISSWNKVLQEEANHPVALDHLLGLYEGRGSWLKYLDTADRQLGSLHGGALRERQAELGLIAINKADSPNRAVGYLESAAEGDHPAVSALQALRRIADDRGDWERVIALGRREADVISDTPRRVVLYEEAATIRLDELLDHDGAAELFAQALALDSDSPASLQFFVRHHYDSEQWSEAATVFKAYEPFINEMDLDEDDDARIEATAYHYKYGVVLSRTASAQDAIKRFACALALTPTHLPSLEAVAPRYFDSGDLVDARKAYRSILRLRGGTGDGDTMTSLYLRLGQTELQLGDSPSALKRFKKALQLSKNNVAALQGIAQIHRLAEDWNSLLSTYNSIIKYARDPDQVIRAYMTKGDVLEQKLKFTDKAILHYEKVLMYDKQNVQAMTRLGQIALAADDPQRAGDLADRAVRSAQLADEKVQAALLKALASGGESVDVAGVVASVRDSSGDGEALAAFSAALEGKTEVPRAEAANAYRETFATF
jgi:tetratricopeptide (TPR) repeat protein